MKALLVVLLIAAGAMWIPARADAACHAPRCVPGSMTVDHEAIGFNVVLPPDYATSGRTYPVVYLLHGGLMDQNAWLAGGETGYSALIFGTGGDIEQFTATLPDSEQAIVVLPSAPGIGAWLDWRNGNHAYETALANVLIPYIDAHYRTVADRAHRAIAGLSAGGYGALETAAEHPDLFASVGAFSGLDDLTTPLVENALVGAGTGVSLLCSMWNPNPVTACASNADLADVIGLGPLGDPLTDQLWYHANNPGDLAVNLRGMNIWLASGNGVPCTATDAEDPGAIGLEAGLIRPTQLRFAADLAATHIPDTDILNPCGVHTWTYWDKDLAQWWPVMVSQWGTAAPSSFDYRSASASFSVWGWDVTASPARAPEFLSLTGAGSAGVTLTGSGLTTLVTGPLFPPGATVELSGATVPAATADAAGRIDFEVSLGTAHTAQQYTVQALLAGQHMTTRRVTFAVE